MWIWLRRLLGLLLLFGRRPQHVAFIMDGNRRFATQRHMDKIGGHKKGYSKMIDVIHWCLELGVPAVSVYAFSIDNFQRSPEEVGSLMRLAEEKYKELAQENGLAEREGVEMRIVGDLSLAPVSVQGAAARLTEATAKLNNKRALLNICFSYTATEELVQAVDAIRSAVASGDLLPGDVCPHLLDSCLHTAADCPPVDLLIRTSGETRLSDYMLWQARGAQLEFIDRLWPDFSFPDFARCILRYQSRAAAQQSLRDLCADAAGSGGGGTDSEQDGRPSISCGLRPSGGCGDERAGGKGGGRGGMVQKEEPVACRRRCCTQPMFYSPEEEEEGANAAWPTSGWRAGGPTAAVHGRQGAGGTGLLAAAGRLAWGRLHAAFLSLEMLLQDISLYMLPLLPAGASGRALGRGGRCRAPLPDVKQRTGSGGVEARGEPSLDDAARGLGVECKRAVEAHGEGEEPPLHVASQGIGGEFPGAAVGGKARPAAGQGAALVVGVTRESRVSAFLKARADARRDWVDQHVGCI